MAVKKGYKQTEVGVIPDDWEAKRLGNFVHLRRGHDLTERDRRTGEIPVVGSAGINGFHDTAIAKAPGVVLGRSGASFGQAHFISSDYWPHNTALYVVDFFGNSEIFTFYFLRAIDFSRHNTGGAQQSLNRNFIAPIVVGVPPLIEQEAIAGALSDADAWIESLEQLIGKKRQIKQGAMQELLTGKRRLPGFSGKWETKRLGDLGSFLKGSGVRKNEANSGDIPCVRYGEIYTHHNDYIRRFNSSISRAVAEMATRLNYGDLLFAGSGETKAEIGKCVAYAHDMEAYAGGDIVILRSIKSVPVFMGYYCNTRAIAEQKAARGQGDAVVHISASALAGVQICVPEIHEQTAIATVLSHMDTEIESLESKLAKAREVKQGMMQELLTGRIRLI